MGVEGEGLSPVVEVQALRAAACDWRLSRGDVGVYAVLLRHADAAGLTYPGPALISRDAHLAVPNVKASIVRLARAGYIRIERRGLRRANHYHLQRSPKVPDRPKTGNAGIPSRSPRDDDDESGNWERTHTQFDEHDSSPTGYAGIPELGMPAFSNWVCRRDANSLLNSPMNSQGSSSLSEDQEPAAENHASTVERRRDLKGLLERLSEGMGYEHDPDHF